MKKEGISRYKLLRIAAESLRNSLRLHFDSVFLFENGSYPSAFQLSVLSLEEFAKAKWIEHYVWTAETNEGYPDQEFEQSWLKLLYQHPEKQMAFIGREIFEYSPKFAAFIKKRGLEEKKQHSVYVGLSRLKGAVDTTSRISTPAKIKKKDAMQMISLVGSEFLEICQRIELEESYFSIEQMDEIFDYKIYRNLLKWPYRTGLKSKRWSKVWFDRIGD
ncbi:MAG: AbiV family abortive infection protein [Sideroxydans sp.]|nr:AbiV family abortive infection protein [Sideroxydans sp.]